MLHWDCRETQLSFSVVVETLFIVLISIAFDSFERGRRLETASNLEQIDTTERGTSAVGSKRRCSLRL